MTETTNISEQKQRVKTWFADLRDQICSAFETLEDELVATEYAAHPPGRFVRKGWNRQSELNEVQTGGGEISLMHGRVFEKVGVNISTVEGKFSDEFRAQIPGAAANGEFWASGVSLVAHMQSPLVPAVHMNTRHIITDHGWFGGGTDLTPMFMSSAETVIDKNDFHAALKASCDRFDPEYYPRFSAWCDEYFFLKHRNETRGVGGIFYDYLKNDWDEDFRFTQAVGETFLEIYPKIVRRHMNKPWTASQREDQLVRRGRYVEFNLLYDRGTTFGLKTGGNVEAILMSLPPEVKWP